MKNRRKNFMIWAVLLTAGLCLALGFGAVKTQAGTGTGSGKTKVIYAKSEDAFASETSKLAKKSQGLSVMSSGEIRPYSSARLIVRVKDGKKQSFTGYGANTVVQSGFGVSVLQFSTPEKAKSAAQKIAALSTVSYVEPDDCTLDLGDTQITEIEGSDTGENTGTSSSMEGLSNPFGYDDDEDVTFASSVSASAAKVTTGRMSWGAAYIQADQYAAYVKKTTKRTIKVAVVDSGVSAHRMLNGRRLAGKDFVDNDNDPTDKNGHGTHVAGTIVDCTPGLNVKILPVRVMNASGVGNPSVVGNGVRYAVNKGAKVINLSLGGYSHYKYLEECISYANRKGATVVIAAGNGSYNTKRICPAHLSAPIVVSAINKNGKRAFFSNYGSSVDVAAPGVGIRSCWKNGGFATADGTSMAAPHISAAAAMYRLTHPSYSPAKIEKFIKNYAKDLGSKGKDKYYGRGVPRMKAAIPVSKKKKKASIDLSKPYSLSAMPSQDIEVHVNDSPEGSSGIAEDPIGIGAGALSGMKKILNCAADAAAQTLLPDPVTSDSATSGSDTSAVSQSSAVSLQTSSNERQSAAALKDDAQAAFFSGENPSAEDTRNPDNLSAKEPSSDNLSSEKDARKLYLYPRQRSDNAVIRDGSIVVGDRLALDAEIVPDPGRPVLLDWESSDPAVASADADGVVLASSEGTAVITASISGIRAEKEDAFPGMTLAEGDPLSGSGTFTVNVVNPSVMTGDASYKVEPAAEEIDLRARIRVPGTLEPARDQDSATDNVLNEPARYILALFRELDDSRILLGAIELGAENMGAPREGDYFTEGESGEEASPSEADDRGEESTNGVLSLDRSTVDGGKADLYLCAAADRLRKMAEREYKTERNRSKSAKMDGKNPEAAWTCSLVIYREPAFAEREHAAAEGNDELVDRLDEEAVCRCSFTLKFTFSSEKEKVGRIKADGEEEKQKEGEEGQKDKSPDKTEDRSVPETGGTDEEAEAADPEVGSGTTPENGTGSESDEEKPSEQQTGSEEAGEQTSSENKDGSEDAAGSVKENASEDEPGSAKENASEDKTGTVKEDSPKDKEASVKEDSPEDKKASAKKDKTGSAEETGSEKETSQRKEAGSAEENGHDVGTASGKQSKNMVSGSERNGLPDQETAALSDRAASTDEPDNGNE